MENLKDNRHYYNAHVSPPYVSFTFGGGEVALFPKNEQPIRVVFCPARHMDMPRLLIVLRTLYRTAHHLNNEFVEFDLVIIRQSSEWNARKTNTGRKRFCKIGF